MVTMKVVTGGRMGNMRAMERMKDGGNRGRRKREAHGVETQRRLETQVANGVG